MGSTHDAKLCSRSPLIRHQILRIENADPSSRHHANSKSNVSSTMGSRLRPPCPKLPPSAPGDTQKTKPSVEDYEYLGNRDPICPAFQRIPALAGPCGTSRASRQNLSPAASSNSVPARRL
uniref:Uncharacterized protein n=1 Tax=Mycena chlorophos TaxID=658473 RepID=A0ABQ0L6C2_MYCCL|nr:predicted protein [Mycena chlorophos]